VPAAAVIPAPIAYTNIVAVKKLVVGSGARDCRLDRALMPGATRCCGHNLLHSILALHTRNSVLLSESRLHWRMEGNFWSVRGSYREQNSVFKAGAALPFCLHDRAWNDKGATMELISSLFVGFDDTNG